VCFLSQISFAAHRFQPAGKGGGGVKTPSDPRMAMAFGNACAASRSSTPWNRMRTGSQICGAAARQHGAGRHASLPAGGDRKQPFAPTAQGSLAKNGEIVGVSVDEGQGLMALAEPADGISTGPSDTSRRLPLLSQPSAGSPG
jgi:hypothetical protein